MQLEKAFSGLKVIIALGQRKMGVAVRLPFFNCAHPSMEKEHAGIVFTDVKARLMESKLAKRQVVKQQYRPKGAARRRMTLDNPTSPREDTSGLFVVIHPDRADRDSTVLYNKVVLLS